MANCVNGDTLCHVDLQNHNDSNKYILYMSPHIPPAHYADEDKDWFSIGNLHKSQLQVCKCKWEKWFCDSNVKYIYYH